MKFAWATDIHLDHTNTKTIQAWCDQIKGRNPDGLFITGDIAEAPTVKGYLEMVAGMVNCPIYFVLGNHDFYGGSVEHVRHGKMRDLDPTLDLHYLTTKHTMWLQEGYAIVGHDGCADAEHGNFDKSRVWLNDFLCTSEYKGKNRADVRNQMLRFADTAAKRSKKIITEAFELGAEHVTFLTHVPPYREVACYMGKQSDDNWAPFFTSKLMGDMLMETAAAWPDRALLVLCGHSHGRSELQAAPNMLVRCGTATYGRPELQGDIEL